MWNDSFPLGCEMTSFHPSLIEMRHFTCPSWKWVISHVSWLISMRLGYGMTHFHLDVKWLISIQGSWKGVISHVPYGWVMSHVPYDWVMSHVPYQWVMSYMQDSGLCSQSCQQPSPISMRHVTCPIWMSHVTCPIWMSHVTYAGLGLLQPIMSAPMMPAPGNNSQKAVSC